MSELEMNDINSIQIKEENSKRQIEDDMKPPKGNFNIYK